MKGTKYLKIAIICLAFAIPNLVFASSYIISTIKNIDHNNDNQSWFRFTEASGGTINDAIILKNLGTQRETVNIYPTDATSNQAGSFIPLLENENQKSIGAWTTLDQKQITLDPNQTAEVNFQIKIPANASPGEYFGSIIKEEFNDSFCGPKEEQKDQKCHIGIQVKTRTGNRIYLNIPGDAKPDITMTNFSYEKHNNNILFKFTFNNKGNIAFEPNATINIYDYLGNKVETISHDLGKSLPGTIIEPMIEWPYNNKIGSYKVKAEINYKQDYFNSLNSLHGSSLSDHSELTIIIFPWFSAISILILISIIPIAWIFKKNQYKKIIKNSSTYHVNEDENIIEIAEKFNIKWQLLAKINRLKPPYIINKNQTIKIPQSKSKNPKQNAN